MVSYGPVGRCGVAGGMRYPQGGGLTSYKPDHRPRLIYRPRRDDDPRDGRKSYSWRDHRDLLTATHQQHDGPIVLIWDNSTSTRPPACGSSPKPGTG